MNVKCRGVINLGCLRNLTPQETLTEIEVAYQAQSQSISMKLKWSEQLKKGSISLKDFPRVKRKFTRQFSSSSCRYIVFMQNFSRYTVEMSLINELHLKIFQFSCFSHILNEEQKMKSIEEVNKLLSILVSLSLNQLLKAVTCDEF